jgi:RNA polymerase sigma factor (sigma-70 family)
MKIIRSISAPLKTFKFTVISRMPELPARKVIDRYGSFTRHMPLITTYADGASVLAIERMHNTPSITSQLTRYNINAFRRIGLVLVENRGMKYLITEEEKIRNLPFELQIRITPRSTPPEDAVLLYRRSDICMRQISRVGRILMMKVAAKEIGKPPEKLSIKDMMGNFRIFGNKNMKPLLICYGEPKNQFPINRMKKDLEMKVDRKKYEPTYYDATAVQRILPNVFKMKGRYLDELIDKKTRLTREQQIELGKEKDKGNRAARDALVISHEKMIKWVAERIFHTYFNEFGPEMISAGRVGLVQAANDYDHRKNTKLSTIAMQRIIWEIKRYLRVEKKHINLSLDMPQTEDEESQGLYDIFEDESSRFEDSLFQSFLLKESTQLMRDILQFDLSTPGRNRNLAIFFYLINLGGRKRTLEEAGKKFGVTRERIRQIKNRMIQKLSEDPRFIRLKRELTEG